MGLYTSSSDFAKDTYLPGFNYQLSHAPGTLMNFFGFDTNRDVKIEGRRAFVKLQVGDSLGQGTIAEGGDYPAPGDIDADEALLELAHLAHTIEFSLEEMEMLDSGKAAAEPIVTKKMTSAQEAMGDAIERQSWGDGTGILANVASSSGATITLDATTTSQVDRDRYIWVDDALRSKYMVVHGTTGATEEDDFTVTNVNESTNVLTCSSADMTSATSAGVLVTKGNWASGGAFRSLEFKGMRAMIADSNTYLGIDRTAAGKGYWKAVVVGNSGTLRDLTTTLVQTLMNRMTRRARGRKQPTSANYAAFASPGTHSSYENIMSPGLRYTVNQMPDIGWGSPLEMYGIPLYRVTEAPRSNIWVAKKDAAKFVRPKHERQDHGLFKFLERGGDIFFQQTAASGQGYASKVVCMLEGLIGLMTERPRDFGVLGDLTETAV